MSLRSTLLSPFLIGLILLLSWPSHVKATALTYKIDANEKACFYAWVDKVGEKIAFYFAVFSISLSMSELIWLGSSRWFIWYWLWSQGSSAKSHFGWIQGKAGRFRVHRSTIWRIFFLFLEWYEYIRRESSRLWNHGIFQSSVVLRWYDWLFR